MNAIHDEGIRDRAKYEAGGIIPADECNREIAFILGKIDGCLDRFTYRFPSAASTGGVYAASDNRGWTPSFWTGMLWLAYEVTGEEKYRRTAEIQLKSFAGRIEKKIDVDLHDLGFIYTLSCVAAYKITGNPSAKRAALRAADQLMTRYLDVAGILQAWGALDDPEQQGRMIIDCCMNLPLLYWASQVTGDARYYDAAYSHACQAAKYLVREDASCFHTFYMDVHTGKPRYGKTHQGYSDSSCWSRGQAWAVYGFILSYLYTKDGSLLELSKKTADYFINRLPDDDVCYWDLIFTRGDEPRDSSAAAIAACGLLELSGQLDAGDADKELYRKVASAIVRSLSAGYTTAGTPESNGLLLHAVYSKPGNNGVDECCIWGDYFYFESLVRLTTEWRRYW